MPVLEFQHVLQPQLQETRGLAYANNSRCKTLRAKTQKNGLNHWLTVDATLLLFEESCGQFLAKLLLVALLISQASATDRETE